VVATDAASSSTHKTELIALCEAIGPIGGTPTAEQAARMKELIDALVQSSDRAQTCTSEPALFNGTHDLLFSTNTGSSAGRFGPFTASEVSQRIEDFPSRLVNSAVLGPLRADLQASFDILAGDKVRVNFESVRFSLFGVTLTSRQFERRAPNAAGTWKILYVDPNLRVLRANKGSIFVLRRREAAAS